MEMNSCLLAGSSNRDEILIIKRPLDSASHQSQQQEHNLQVCQICGDEVGLTPEGEQFAACHECAFPICQACYEYERREGSQVCPQCKTRLRRLKGYPRVEGDEDEDDVDDLENEFKFHRKAEEDTQNADCNPQAACGSQEIPLLTEEETSEGTPQRQHAIIISPANGVETKRILSLRVPNSVQPVYSRSINPSKDLTAYGFGTVAWREKMGNMDQIQEKSDGDTDSQDLPLMVEVNQLSRKLPIPSSQINPYRLIIIIRLVLLGLFLCFRVMNPVKDAYALWLVSVICEIWFSLSWITDQFTKWQPIQRETNLDKLSSRFETKGQRSQLAAVDIFVNAADPFKEHPLVTANTVLSVLAVDYPVGKVSCYVSDDGASMLTFEVLSETTEFARKWVPFCSRFNIEPRAPEWYFSEKMDYLKDKALTEFVRERRGMKREYEEFKVRINSLVAKSREVPEEGWTMPDGTPWPGNDVQDHHGMIQIFCGKSQEKDMDVDNGLPCLIYVSREKRPGFNHHKKAGAINALIRVSAVLTNAPYLLNLDCDCYINNSKVLKEAMCFMMDPLRGRRVCYVQFPHTFDISQNDDYANQNNLFFSINMKGLDGIQGPLCIGNGCVFRRQALYGYDPPKTRKKKKNGMFNCWPKWYHGGYSLLEKKKEESDYNSEMKLIVRQEGLESSEDGAEDVKVQAESINFSEDEVQRKLGQSSVFIASTLQEFGGAPRNVSPATLLKEAIHVISCAYEDKTQWGKEVGWIYGSVTDNILTSFQMHSHGWRSIYYIPPRPAFVVSLPSNFPDRLRQVLRNAVGSTEIFLSRRCPLWYGKRGDLKFLQRLAYINATIYPWTSIPLLAYCVLPAVCMLRGTFFIPELSSLSSLLFLSLFISIVSTSILEIKWSGVGIDEWWKNQQFWVIGAVSAHIFAVFQGIVKLMAGINTSVTASLKKKDDKKTSKLYAFQWTILLIPPTTLLLINLVGVVAGVAEAVLSGYSSWGVLFGKLFFSSWVILHLYPFLKGLLGRQNRTPTIVIIWSVLLAVSLAFFWVRIDPFIANSDTPFLEDCGVDCK